MYRIIKQVSWPALSTLFLILLLQACGGGGDTGENNTTQGTNDGSANNGDGHSTVTLADNAVSASQRDYTAVASSFGSVPILAQKVSHKTSSAVRRFNVSGSHIYFEENKGAFDTPIVSFSLNDNKNTDNLTLPHWATGMHANGELMGIVDGSEEVLFYKLNQGEFVDGAPFYRMKSFNNESKFLSEIYVESDRFYVIDTDEIITAPYSDTDNQTTLTDIPSFSNVYFSSDATYLYIAIRDGSDSDIYKFDKSAIGNGVISATAHADLGSVHISGFAAGGKFLYVSDHNAEKIYFYDKSFNSIGDIDVAGVKRIDVVEDKLYAYDANHHEFIVFDIN